MSKNIAKYSVWTLLLFLSLIVDSHSAKIYENLVKCYRGNNTQPFVSNSFQVFLELLRKIETAHPTSLDIRILTANILHQLRLDGIERSPGVMESEYVTPYSIKGIMEPKFKVLLQMVSNVPMLMRFEDVLTPFELCILHKMVSSSVDPVIRGDEMEICPLTQGKWTAHNRITSFETGRDIVISREVSKCPLENGVVFTHDFGSFSPGIVIASLAAGLQPQAVPVKKFLMHQMKSDPSEHVETMNKREVDKKIDHLLKTLDELDNTMISNLAGDLAEVCIFQSPTSTKNMTVGLGGRWNDTWFPRARYLDRNYRWEMTDSELIAGIDGYFLARHINSWNSRIGSMRLSQLLDMYYSAAGVPNFSGTNEDAKTSWDSRSAFDGRYYPDQKDSACDRIQMLERISRKKLLHQTYLMAQVIQVTPSNVAFVSVNDSIIDAACKATIDRFFKYAVDLLSQTPNCEQMPPKQQRSAVDLTMIIDGSRSKYENLKFISVLTEVADISRFASNISIVHGESSRYLVTSTNSIIEAFESLHRFTDRYPAKLVLADCLTNILGVLDRQSVTRENGEKVAGLSNVVLIISQSQRLSQKDYEHTKDLMDGSFLQFPDLYFIFLTNDGNTFRSLIADIPDYRKEQIKIIETDDLEPRIVMPEISNILKTIPKRLLIPKCVTKMENSAHDENSVIRSEYEDYVSTHQALRYRLNGIYLKKTPTLQIQFQGVGYGVLTVCKSTNSRNFECRNLANTDTAVFNITNGCDTDPCPNIHFTVQLDQSYIKCTENDCQYPDQVRFLIRMHSNLNQCNSGSKVNISQLSSICVILLLVVSAKSFLNRKFLLF